jgi:hypothetical protein
MTLCLEINKLLYYIYLKHHLLKSHKMKKVLLLLAAAASSVMSFGQIAAPIKAKIKTGETPTAVTATYKTTAVIHDTLVMTNVTSADTLTNYHISIAGGLDSGYMGGTNFLNMNGFAERYEFNPADSSVQVMGVLAYFAGRVNSASTKTAVFKTWSQAAPISPRTTLHYNGFPGAVLDTVITPYTGLALADTAWHGKVYWFASPTTYLTDTFFVGYTTAYTFTALGGDTIGVATTRTGGRNSPIWTIAGTDTTINVQNASSIGTTWLDEGVNIGFKINFFMFPVVNTKSSLLVHGISRNNLTFYGNYPNPANNVTNIKFSLGATTDVAIEVMDMNGRVMQSINKQGLTEGTHIIALETSALPAGDYIYMIRTTEGDGIANKLVIVR